MYKFHRNDRNGSELMKKFVSLMIVIALTLSLCACTGSGGSKSATKGLQVGFAKETITPGLGVNLRGYGNDAHRASTGYLDHLYATCIALRDGDDTVLLYSTDLLTADAAWTAEARAKINATLGVPEENIQIGATHSHTGPAIGFEHHTSIAEWKTTYMDALLNTAKKAIEDLAPTTMYGKEVMTENQNFVRHYKMSDGSYAGSNFGNWSLTPVDHAVPGDKGMTLIKFDREGDKKDILLMNWQAHCDMIDGTMFSADYVGVVRSILEKETGMDFIFFLGATGDQNPNSRIKEEKADVDYKEYGAELAQYALDALPSMTEKVEGEGIGSRQETINYRSNLYGQDRLTDALEVNRVFRESGDISASNTLAKSKGFQSVYECNGIVNCSNYPEFGEFTVNVHRIGGLGFVAAPYEMFSENGLYIKNNSPYDFTIVSTVTNAYTNYFPTKEAYEYGCYESYTARFDAGIGEDTAAKFVEMLKEIQ